MRKLLIAAFVFSIFSATVCFAQEAYKTDASDVNEPYVLYDSSINENSYQQTNISREYYSVENDYKNVIKYFNKTISDSEAQIIARAVLYYSSVFKLDPILVMAVITVESKFHSQAVSPKGAMGLGQLMPGTASIMGVKNAFDIEQNIYGTAKYLRQQYDRWYDNEKVLDLMLASYNAGPQAVANHKGIPPYRETQNYVVRVKKYFRFFIYGY